MITTVYCTPAPEAEFLNSEIQACPFSQKAREVLFTEAQALKEAASRINSSFESVIDLLLHTKGKVILLGLGKSGLIAQKIAATLSSTGTPAIFLHAAEALHGDLGIYQPGDPTILISKSGSTKELVQLIPILKQFQSPLIGILGNLNSPLAEKVDFILDGSVSEEADPLGIVPTSSTTVALALGDAIASTLMYARNFLPEDFARYHPSGQLGKSLTQTVGDIFHPLHKIATGHIDDTAKAIVLKLSEKPLGACCIINENQELLGLVTDGDIRRTLTEIDDIRLLTARDIMTTSPTVTYPDVSLSEAIRQMEDRKSQIATLPVIDRTTQKCLGLLRIHDIYQPQL